MPRPATARQGLGAACAAGRGVALLPPVSFAPVCRMMRPVLLVAIAALLIWGAVTLGQRGSAAIERMVADRIANAFEVLGVDWVDVAVDGLRVELTGHAPESAAQELAVATARSVVPIATVTDATTATLAPPERREPVLVEMHREGEALVLTGRVHGLAMRDALHRLLAELAPDLVVRDLTGTNAARPGRGWERDLRLAVLAAARVPDAYIHLGPRAVTVEGLAPNAASRDALSEMLVAAAPPGTTLSLALSIPAQVIAPFAVVAVKDPGGGVRVESCAARSPGEAAEIEGLMHRAGVEPRPGLCVSGLGGPVGDWPGAVAAGLAGLTALPAGRLALEYRAVLLLATPPSTPAEFESALAQVTAALPPGYAAQGRVEADHPLARQAIARGAYWMQLAHAGDGVLLSGMAAGEVEREGLVTYAAALFGKTRVVDRLNIGGAGAPPGWQIAGLAGLAALAETGSGMVEMADDRFAIEGRLYDPLQAAALDRALRARLDTVAVVATDFTIDLPGAVAAQPIAPDRCAVALNGAAALRRIEFEPGSRVVSATSAGEIDALAAVLARCPAAHIEIGGHTDSQGPEDRNLTLSQGRADSVRDQLIDRGVAPERLTAVGYGESQPVADNATEQGRALNRRIAFRFIAQTAP